MVCKDCGFLSVSVRLGAEISGFKEKTGEAGPTEGSCFLPCTGTELPGNTARISRASSDLPFFFNCWVSSERAFWNWPAWSISPSTARRICWAWELTEPRAVESA
ncbi:hypothetical protein DW094_04230 [Ruminococcaceae bacterium AM07-15]|nr:hypothetical protein DW094_04230 [Ruminococcaceae bacterium AM07-15]